LITDGLVQMTPADQTNVLREGTLGVRIKPTKTLVISLDGDLGHANKPIYPISERITTRCAPGPNIS